MHDNGKKLPIHTNESILKYFLTMKFLLCYILLIVNEAYMYMSFVIYNFWYFFYYALILYNSIIYLECFTLKLKNYEILNN